MVTAMGNERGSVLIIAVVAMLVMGVLSISFALLASLETKIGVNFKQQSQALALAEAGLEVARDLVKSAGYTGGNGFTPWFGGGFNHILATGTVLSAGRYWARIDNDCRTLGGVSPFVPFRYWMSARDQAASQ